ncbi:hypothetical protein NE865_14383 [Phthorimaea operculella]|nr:hypothetical protein NE865_14383 [Phthorimaea operculella]
MKQTLFLVLCTLGVALGVNYNSLKVKFGQSSARANVEYFYDIPRTALEAEQNGWTQFVKPYDSKVEGLYMYCLDNLNICPLYNQNGFVAGLQISVPVEEFQAVGNTAELRFKQWQAPAAFGEPSKVYWTLPKLFVGPESLKSGAVPTIENGQTLQDGGLWIHGLNDELLKIPITKEELDKSVFKMQNCIPNMGLHYYHNMTTEMLCENFLPWFAQVHNGELVASGFQFFGKLTKEQPGRQWFEDPRPYRETAWLAIPLGPQCLYDWAEDYGILSMHIYYTDSPWTITCAPDEGAQPVPGIDWDVLMNVMH